MKVLSFLTVLCIATVYAVPAVKVESLSKRVGGRIIGGESARAGQFPFVASIQVVTNTSTFFCAGALWKTQFIITAGQCVHNAKSFTIHLGTNTLSGQDPNRITLSSSSYVLHHEYDPLTLANDIGIIKLHQPVTFTSYIQSVGHMPFSTLAPGTKVTAVGWGQTSDATPGNVDKLNYVDLSVLSQEECQLTYGSAITYHMICVQGNFNEGTCHGDTGSPLIEHDGEDMLFVGVSSFGSANGCESADPSGFSRASSYSHWILAQTANRNPHGL